MCDFNNCNKIKIENSRKKLFVCKNEKKIIKENYIQ